MNSFYVKALIGIAFSILLSSCVPAATVPVVTAELDKSVKAMSPPPDKALIYVYRRPYFVLNHMQLTTVIDDHYSFFVTDNTYFAGLIEPGDHKITAKLNNSTYGQQDNAGTHIILNAKAGEKYYIDIDFVELRYEKITVVDNDLGSKMLKFKTLMSGPGGNEKIAEISPTKKINHSASANTASSPGSTSPREKITFKLPKVATLNRDAMAVVIGNRNYAKNNPDVPNVNFAHNDADMMKRYLVETLGYREGNIIFLKDAAQGQMLSTFGGKDNPKGTLYNYVRPGQSDVFVYYSGHGAPGLQNGKGYLLPVDANPATVELNGYPLEVLYENLAKIPSRSMTVVIDACFSGGSAGGTVVQNASSISLRRVESSATLKNGAVFSAAGTDQVASWDKESNLGLFTRYFLEGVSGQADADGFGNKDGRVTTGELKKYLESEVGYMARRLYLREQNPQVSGSEALVLATLQ